MQAVRLENYGMDDWRAATWQRLRRRYPAVKTEGRQSAFVVLIRLNKVGWNSEDEAFFASLKTEGLIQRWEALETMPPAPKSSKDIFAEIGYRVGEGQHLTPKQQDTLFSQLLNLELRAEQAESDLAKLRDSADELREFAQRTVERHNEFAGLLKILEEFGLKISGDFADGWGAEDTQSGRVLLQGATLAEVFRVALRYRLDKQ